MRARKHGFVTECAAEVDFRACAAAGVVCGVLSACFESHVCNTIESVGRRQVLSNMSVSLRQQPEDVFMLCTMRGLRSAHACEKNVSGT